MAEVQLGRITHDRDETGVVFVIGMRVNKLHRPDAYLPVFRAMGPMIAELSRDPDSGFLGTRVAVGLRGPTLIQYWRSVEDLYAYAGDASKRHRPAWLAFFARAKRTKGAVGIWHETYEVARAESMYVDMPAEGLLAAVGWKPVTKRLDRARDRIA